MAAFRDLFPDHFLDHVAGDLGERSQPAGLSNFTAIRGRALDAPDRDQRRRNRSDDLLCGGGGFNRPDHRDLYSRYLVNTVDHRALRQFLRGSDTRNFSRRASPGSRLRDASCEPRTIRGAGTG